MSDHIDRRILGERIAEARRISGQTPESVAERLGCGLSEYISIERGERKPAAGQIVALAALLGCQLHDLVRPSEPLVELQPQLQRIAVELSTSDEAVLNSAIEELQRLVEDYRELERMMHAPLRFNYPSPIPPDPMANASQRAEMVAEVERRRLGMGDQPVLSLRSTLEWDVGLRIFYGELPTAITGLYAYVEQLGGCMLINRRHPPERRRLSMAQGYSHLLQDWLQPRIDRLGASGRHAADEIFSEQFALAFLMPAKSVRQRFGDLVTTTGNFHVGDLRRLSHFYSVSVEAMALRLEQLGLISKVSWQFLKESNSPRQPVESLGVNDQPFPERYLFLAVHAYEQGYIGDSDLARYLRCDIVTARERVTEMLTSLEVVDQTGEPRSVQLDFRRSLIGAAS